jgi:phospholipid transport system substrate-binding protein
MTSTSSKTIRSRWIRRWGIALVASALLAAPAVADEAAEARAVVRKTVDQVLEILAREGLSDDQRRQQIEEIAYERFDFATISRLVLSRKWKRFSPEQRTEFIEQFKLQLSKNYGSRITRYDQEKVEIRDHRLEGNGDVTVRTRIDGGAADGIEVNYRLRRKDRREDGPWMVIDVIVEGVSLVSSYRSQFAEVLDRNDPSEVLRQLREKNAADPT